MSVKVWKELSELLKKMEIPRSGFDDLDLILQEQETEEPKKWDLINQRVAEGRLIIVDPAHVIAIAFYHPKLIKYVGQFLKAEDLEYPITLPDLDDIVQHWIGNENYELKPRYTSLFTADFLRIVWDFSAKLDQPIQMTIGDNTPLEAWVGEYIQIFVAPRIEDSDGSGQRYGARALEEYKTRIEKLKAQPPAPEPETWDQPEEIEPTPAPLGSSIENTGHAAECPD